jgi:predicted nucleic acid-binding protein
VKRFVVDASVGAKWAALELLEPLADRANEFLRQYVAGAVQILVPDLFWLEIGIVLWKSARRGTITPALAQHVIEAMIDRGFTTLPTITVLPDALRIATDFGRTVYDSSYVALAVATGSELLTADERLVNVLGSSFPLRWLGAF